MILILDKATGRTFRGPDLAAALNEISSLFACRHRGTETVPDYWLVTFSSYELRFPQNGYELKDVLELASLDIARDLVHGKQTHEVYRTENRI